MKNKRLFAILLATTLLVTAFINTSKVSAAYPSFTISSVKTDETVTIQTKDMPAGYDFKVLMGEYNTRGEDGIESALFNSASGGAFQVTVDIPAALKGRAMISIRIESTTGGYFYYNWFWNNKDNGTWPGGEAPKPTQPPVTTVPTISIKAAVKDSSVTISGIIFPADTDFTVRMGKMWTQSLGGIEVAQFNTGAGGNIEAVFDVPAELTGLPRIAIRVDAHTGGWYAYNWFWNSTANK